MTGLVRTGSVIIAGQVIPVTQKSTPVPAVVSVTPNSGSGAMQTFTLEYSDSAGAAHLKQVYAWFKAKGVANNSCELYYSAANNQINLLNDAGTAWLAATPGAATPLQNSQCSLNVTTMTATLNGNTLILSLPMTFEAAYAGTKSVYLFASDVSGVNTGWQQLGTWTVP